MEGTEMTAEKSSEKRSSGDPKARVKTSLSFDQDLWKRFQMRCLEIDLSQQDAMALAIEQWMQPRPLAVAAEYPSEFIEEVMEIVNDPRSDMEKILRNLLKQVVDIRYSSNVNVSRR
jgi:hypothetical protein